MQSTVIALRDRLYMSSGSPRSTRVLWSALSTDRSEVAGCGTEDSLHLDCATFGGVYDVQRVVRWDGLYMSSSTICS